MIAIKKCIGKYVDECQHNLGLLLGIVKVIISLKTICDNE